MGTLSVEGSTVANNTASNLGGGVRAKDGLLLYDSNVIGNHGDNNGGGLRVSGNTTIKRSTIANNTSKHVAGASLGNSATSPIIIEQSTISGNESSNSEYGAGVKLGNDAIIRNSTITDNKLENTSLTRYGAGISLSSGVQLTLSSTIVTDNTTLAGNNPAPLVYRDDIGKASGASGVYTILGSHNMIDYSSVAIPTDTIAESAKLNALGDNGGPTLTHMPKVDSQAIDNGKANGFSCDQRDGGFARVVGFSADIGAVEVQDDENGDRIFANGFEAASTTCN